MGPFLDPPLLLRHLVSHPESHLRHEQGDVMAVQSGPPQSGSEPSPYVSIYVPRKQAEEIRRVVLWHATGTAKSNRLWAALKNIDKALTENA